jgi:hypothetical protein
MGLRPVFSAHVRCLRKWPHPSREMGSVEVGRLLAQLAVDRDFLFECLYRTQA